VKRHWQDGDGGKKEVLSEGSRRRWIGNQLWTTASFGFVLNIFFGISNPVSAHSTVSSHVGQCFFKSGHFPPASDVSDTDTNTYIASGVCTFDVSIEKKLALYAV
jgi:hypothetical protein